MHGKKLTYKKTHNPCDDCLHSFSKNNQESNVCKICEFKQSLDLINRLQAENEKLQKFKAYFDFYYGSDIEILGIDENGDTTSFDEFYNCAIANAESIEHHITHIIKTAKAEAYKEFAERLKEKSHKCFMGADKAVTVSNINNLLKEMVGENDE